jgi:hypothetical protein
MLKMIRGTRLCAMNGTGNIDVPLSAASQNHLDPLELEVKFAKAFKYRIKSGSGVGRSPP